VLLLRDYFNKVNNINLISFILTQVMLLFRTRGLGLGWLLWEHTK